MHVCLDLDGQLRLGPRHAGGRKRPLAVRDLPGDGLDYGVDPCPAENQFFLRQLAAFLPWLEAEDLVPDMRRIPAQAGGQGFSGTSKFAGKEGDLEGLINLVGIESPGLTSAAAMAEGRGTNAGR